MKSPKGQSTCHGAMERDRSQVTGGQAGVGMRQLVLGSEKTEDQLQYILSYGQDFPPTEMNSRCHSRLYFNVSALQAGFETSTFLGGAIMTTLDSKRTKVLTFLTYRGLNTIHRG